MLQETEGSARQRDGTNGGVRLPPPTVDGAAPMDVIEEGGDGGAVPAPTPPARSQRGGGTCPQRLTASCCLALYFRLRHYWLVYSYVFAGIKVVTNALSDVLSVKPAAQGVHSARLVFSCPKHACLCRERRRCRQGYSCSWAADTCWSPHTRRHPNKVASCQQPRRGAPRCRGHLIRIAVRPSTAESHSILVYISARMAP